MSPATRNGHAETRHSALQLPPPPSDGTRGSHRRRIRGSTSLASRRPYSGNRTNQIACFTTIYRCTTALVRHQRGHARNRNYPMDSGPPDRRDETGQFALLKPLPGAGLRWTLRRTAARPGCPGSLAHVHRRVLNHHSMVRGAHEWLCRGACDDAPAILCVVVMTLLLQRANRPAGLSPLYSRVGRSESHSTSSPAITTRPSRWRSGTVDAGENAVVREVEQHLGMFLRSVPRSELP